MSTEVSELADASALAAELDTTCQSLVAKSDKVGVTTVEMGYIMLQLKSLNRRMHLAQEAQRKVLLSSPPISS
jgi:hypothetical protein